MAQKPPDSPHWRVKIADFGISKQTLETSGTALRTPIGTRLYLAPEVSDCLKSHKETSVYTNKVDIWSLGCVLFNISSKGHTAFPTMLSLERYCDGLDSFNSRNLPIHLGNHGKTFLELLLRPEPDERPSAAEALEHLWVKAEDFTMPLVNSTLSTSAETRFVSRRNLDSLPQKSDTATKLEFTAWPNSESSSGRGNDTVVRSDPGVPDYSDAVKPPARLTEPLLDISTLLPPQIPPTSNRINERKTKRAVKEDVVPTNDYESVSPASSMSHSSMSTVVNKANKERMPKLPSSSADEIRKDSKPDLTENETKQDDFIMAEWLAKNANLLEKRPNSAVHLAAKQGRLDVVKILVDRGFDVHAKESFPWVSLLSYDLGATAATRWAWKNAAASRTWIKDRAILLHNAVLSGQLERIQWLVREQQADISEKGSDGWTLLHHAASVGQLEALKWLIQQWPSGLLEMNRQGRYPHHYAAENGHLEVLKWLANQQPELLHPDPDNSTPFVDNLTPLHCAARGGHAEVVQWLIEQGVELNARYDGATPLHYAARRGHLAVVQLLVESGASSSSRQDKYFTTPIHIATYAGSLRVVQWLMAQGKNIDNFGGEFGPTLLHVAASGGHVAMVQWLVEQGADIQYKNDNSADEEDLGTPLHYASALGRLEVVKWLMGHGAGFTVKNNVGQTPLHTAASHRQLEVIKLLVQEGANIFEKTPNDRTARREAEKADGTRMARWRYINGKDRENSGTVGWLREQERLSPRSSVLSKISWSRK